MSAWRPYQNLIEGILDNTRPGRVQGWMSFAGVTEPVTFDLAGDFHRDIRGAKIHLTNPSPAEQSDEMAEYMEGFATHQTGIVGDITAGLPPQDYGDYPYIEWYSDQNGRVVLELDPEQVEVIGTPLAWEQEKPISREDQDRNMGRWLTKLSEEVGAPAIVVGQPPEAVERPDTISDSKASEAPKETPQRMPTENGEDRVAEEKPEAFDLQPLSGHERNEPMAEKSTTEQNQNEKNGPLYSLRSDQVQGSIWDRERPNGKTTYSWNMSKSYKDNEGTWQRVTSFDPADVPHAKEVLAKIEQIMKEELGQEITSEVKVGRREEVKRGQKQSV
jgi:hypothetical protein